MKYSLESRQKMSEAAKKKWQTPWGIEQKKILAEKAAKQHALNVPDKSKRKVIYISEKNNNEPRTCLSSYEFVYCDLVLEKDDSVMNYETQVYYEVNGQFRSLDFLIHYKDGSHKVVEIKPKKRLNEEYHKQQIVDSNNHASSNGWKFEIITEDNLPVSPKEALKLADDYRLKNYEMDLASYRKNRCKERAKRHYDKKIAQDKITVYCEFCKENHEALRLTYDKNIARNGKYICEKAGGAMNKGKPKLSLRKINPYAAEGKKQCNGPCGLIKKFEEFDKDKSKKDGLVTRCKECRKKK